MNFKVVAGLLFLSMLFNIAGIVFLVGFISARGDVKNLQKERSQMANNMALWQEAAAKERAAAAMPATTTGAASGLPDRVEVRNFVSHHDGVEDQLAVRLPGWVGGPREYTLVVFLHGMGSNLREPFVTPADVSISNAFEAVDRSTALLSCSYRKEQAWGNDASFADITQNIRHVMYELPFKRIVIAGTSMGGCTALNYAVAAPPDIKEKIAGVICVEGAGDLALLYQHTRVEGIRVALAAAFGGTPQQVPQVYNSKSVLHNLDKLPVGARFAIVTADHDNVVPAALQLDLVNQLKGRNVPLLHVQLPGGHHVPPWTTFAQAYRYVLGKS